VFLVRGVIRRTWESCIIINILATILRHETRHLLWRFCLQMGWEWWHILFYWTLISLEQCRYINGDLEPLPKCPILMLFHFAPDYPAPFLAAQCAFAFPSTPAWPGTYLNSTPTSLSTKWFAAITPGPTSSSPYGSRDN
jgi:hypothetical protein